MIFYLKKEERKNLKMSKFENHSSPMDIDVRRNCQFSDENVTQNKHQIDTECIHQIKVTAVDVNIELELRKKKSHQIAIDKRHRRCHRFYISYIVLRYERKKNQSNAFDIRSGRKINIHYLANKYNVHDDLVP